MKSCLYVHICIFVNIYSHHNSFRYSTYTRQYSTSSALEITVFHVNSTQHVKCKKCHTLFF